MKMKHVLPAGTLAGLVVLCCSVTWAGPYSGPWGGVAYDDARFVGWATGITVHWPAGFTPDYNNPSVALGPAPGTSNDVLTLGNEGWAVLTFGRTIRNHPGPDLAVFENGYNDPIFAELAFVEVSTDNVHYARFPSVSLTASWPGEYGTIDASNVYNLAGKHINNFDQAWLGTPFDLDDLANDPLVTGGLVDLDEVHYVRIVDVYGHDNGTTTDEATKLIDPGTGVLYTTNHVIYDGGNNGLLLRGFDLDAVGILEPLPVCEPASLALVTSGALGAWGVLRRRRRRA
ncbi:MAG TPA: PEP-CTERM sorting domain-containing protein [Planctomycetota bacterium]|nr:PEP-CTERM sorting domain-containing protein [Planctomycetota bacterium]